jgi:hypothetical protein
MDERDLRRLIAEVRSGMLACSGVTVVVERFVYKPRRQGRGDVLKLLWWGGPKLLNPHFAVGTKHTDASRIFYEPLVTRPVVATVVNDLRVTLSGWDTYRDA